MNPEQLFVGSTAVILGLVALVAGATNREFFFRFAKIRWVERRGGRGAARATYAVIGVTLISLGIAIAMGFAPNASAPAQ